MFLWSKTLISNAIYCMPHASNYLSLVTFFRNVLHAIHQWLQNKVIRISGKIQNYACSESDNDFKSECLVFQRKWLLIANWNDLSYLDETVWRMYYESFLVHLKYLTEQFGWQNDYHLFDGQNEFVNIHKNRKSVKQKMKKCRNKHFGFIIHSKVIFGRYYWHINIFCII